MLEALAKHTGQIWLKVVVRAKSRFAVVLEWLHADTTSVYFEGGYEDAENKLIDNTTWHKSITWKNFTDCRVIHPLL